MAIGITSTNAIKIKNQGQAGISAVECACCGCDYDVWRFTASQSLVGYAPFECENAVTPVDIETRYLQYQVLCNAGVTGTWCGGASQIKTIDVSTYIDPYTGLSKTTGLPSNGYICSGGSDCKEICNDTSKVYTCTALPENCIDEGITQTVYYLLQPNTINDAINRINAKLNGWFTVDGLPGPNTSGELKIDTYGADALLAWSPYSGEATASRWASYGVAELTKSIVKLKRDVFYTISSYDQYGEFIDAWEYYGAKDSFVYLEPATGSDGSKSFAITKYVMNPGQSDSYSVPAIGRQCSATSVTLDIVSQNQLTTKTLRIAPPPSDGDDPEDQPCASFLIAPDCKSYMHSLYTVTGTSGMSWSYTGEFNCEPTFGSGTQKSGGTWTWQTTACHSTKLSINPHYSSENRYDSWGDVTFNETCTNGFRTRTISSAEGSETTTLQVTYCSSQGWGNEPHGTHCFPLYGANCGTDTQGGTYEHSGGTSIWTRTCTENTKDSTTTRTLSENDSFNSNTPAWQYEHQGKTKTCPGSDYSSTGYRQNTVTITYSDEVSAAFNDENQNFETKSWSSSGGLCAWKTLASNGTMNEQTAYITINSIVNGDPLKDYNVTVQMVIEQNSDVNNNATRMYDSHENKFTAKGQELKSSILSLVAQSNGQTKCLVHYSAVAYEA